jgi:hypothetical protein
MSSFNICGYKLSISGALQNFVSFSAFVISERVGGCSSILISSYVSSFSFYSFSSLVLCVFLSSSLFRIPEKYFAYLFSCCSCVTKSSHRPPESHLTLNGPDIPFVHLGVIFDKKVTWRLHIEMIEAKTFRTFIRTYSL